MKTVNLKYIDDVGLEKFIVKRADFVISNTPELAYNFIERLKVPKEKIGVITCGYDETDFNINFNKTQNKEFVITHIGTFYKKRKT